MKFATTLTAASIIAFSSMASAEQQLSMAEMDGVSAGGFAIADAVASALGNVTSAQTATDTAVVSIGTVAGQFGAIHIIQSDSAAGAAADSDAKAIAAAASAGTGIGSGLADTTSYAQADTDSGVVNPSAIATTWQTTIATSVLLGNPAASVAASTAGASLTN